jgi:hypothetical protein
MRDILKNKNKLSLTIIILVTAVVLFSIIFSTVNQFTGNPISAALANTKINIYIGEKYPALDLDRAGHATYNFKDKTYGKMVKSKTNNDIYFHVEYLGDNKFSDDYDGSVLKGFNTLSRLSNEYSLYVESLLKENPNTPIADAHVLYDSKENDNLAGILKPGMAFDKTLPVTAELSVHFLSSDCSPQNLAKAFAAIHSVLKENGCIFIKYEITVENGSTLVMVSQVTPADIEGGQLANLIAKALDDPGTSPIHAFTKGDKK